MLVEPRFRPWPGATSGWVFVKSRHAQTDLLMINVIGLPHWFSTENSF